MNRQLAIRWSQSDYIFHPLHWTCTFVIDRFSRAQKTWTGLWLSKWFSYAVVTKVTPKNRPPSKYLSCRCCVSPNQNLKLGIEPYARCIRCNKRVEVDSHTECSACSQFLNNDFCQPFKAIFQGLSRHRRRLPVQPSSLLQLLFSRLKTDCQVFCSPPYTSNKALRI